MPVTGNEGVWLENVFHRTRSHFQAHLTKVASLFNVLLALNRTLDPDAEPQTRPPYFINQFQRLLAYTGKGQLDNQAGGQTKHDTLAQVAKRIATASQHHFLPALVERHAPKQVIYTFTGTAQRPMARS